MAEENTESATANAEQTPPSQGANGQETPPVTPGANGEGATTPPKPDIPMIDYNGYPMPKDVHRQIKQEGFGEGQRKLAKEYEETGQLRSDSDISDLKVAQEFYKSIGKELGANSENGFTSAEMKQLIDERDRKMNGSLQELVQQKNDEITNLNSELSNVVVKQNQDRVDSGLEKLINADESLLDGVSEDVMALIKLRHTFIYDENEKTSLWVDVEGKPQYNGDGSKKTAHDAYTEWLNSEKSRNFKKPSEQSGAGGNYNSGTPKDQLLKGLLDSRPKKVLTIHPSAAPMTLQKKSS